MGRSTNGSGFFDPPKVQYSAETKQLITTPKSSAIPEKIRLANVMTYGVEEPKSREVQSERFSYLRRRIEGKRKYGDQQEEVSPVNDKDRFSELIREVKERRQFLDQMRVMGKDEQYKNIVETEISQLVREMELIDRQRCAELERIITASQR